MLRSFAEQLDRNQLLKTGDPVVAAVSGGADSMALLHLLAAFSKTLEQPLRMIVAHLNHGLRGHESDADAEFVQKSARQLGLDCVVDHRDIAALSASRGSGIEETSRHERYAFFERVCLLRGASTVAVAHHADDQAETVLHRVVRGTGLRGLAGMPMMRPLTVGSTIRLIRPLLPFTRSTLREYLASQQIAFREDRTNADHEPLRNRIRHAVLPLLEQQLNPQVRGALLRLAEQARWFEEYFRDNVVRTFDTLLVSRTDQSLVLNAAALTRKSKLLQTGLIRHAYASFGLGEVDLSFFHLVSVADLLDDHTSGKMIQLPGGVVVEKRYQQLIFTYATQPSTVSSADQVVVRVPGRTVLPLRAMEICCEVSTPGPDAIAALRGQGNRMSEYLDFDTVHPPVLIRSRRAGERFFPLGAPGSKKLSDYLTDAKVPPEERRNIAVVCDQLGPIWVVGHRIDDRVKLTPQTRRVLHIEAKELTS